MIQTITIRQAAQILNYKDVRSVIRWCNLHGVDIIREPGSKKHFIFKEQFDTANDEKIINHFKMKYGERWLEIIRMKKGKEQIDLTKLNTEIRNKKASSSHYQPKGEYEKQTLSRFTQLVSAR